MFCDSRAALSQRGINGVGLTQILRDDFALLSSRYGPSYKDPNLVRTATKVRGNKENLIYPGVYGILAA